MFLPDLCWTMWVCIGKALHIMDCSYLWAAKFKKLYERAAKGNCCPQTKICIDIFQTKDQWEVFDLERLLGGKKPIKLYIAFY